MGWLPDPLPTRGERIAHRYERFADGTRRRGRRAWNVVRRNTTRVLTFVDYLFMAIKWRLVDSGTRRSCNNPGIILNPIGVFAFLERHVLEACQLVCKSWHRAIEESHSQLALRTLNYFWLYEQERKRQKTIYYSSYQRIPVECGLRDTVCFAARSDRRISVDKLDDRVMRLCRWSAFRLLRNAYVKELKLVYGTFVFCPLTAIKTALGPRSSLSAGTLILEKLPLPPEDICAYRQATFNSDTLRFHELSPRDFTSLSSAMSCSAMLFHTSIGSLSSLKELLKRAKSSSVTTSLTVIKVNVIDLIQVIRSFHPSKIPQELCLEMNGNTDFESGEFDPTFDLLTAKMSCVSMTPLSDEDGKGEHTLCRYRISADIEGYVLDATIGLRIVPRQGGLKDALVRKFQYRLFRDVRPRVSLRPITKFRMPTELLVDILASLSRKDVDSCQLVSSTMNGIITTLPSVLPLHHLDYFKMNIAESRTSNTPLHSLVFSYHFAESCVRDVRIFHELEKTGKPLSVAKTHLAFAHFRNTFIRQGFPFVSTAEFFSRYFPAGLNANIGTVDLTRPDQCEILLRFNSIRVAYGNAAFVVALIERFEQLEDTSKMPSSFTSHTETFEVRDVFKPPAYDVRVSIEPAIASIKMGSSTGTSVCHRRRIRNIQTKDELEVCLIRPSTSRGVRTVTFRLISRPS